MYFTTEKLSDVQWNVWGLGENEPPHDKTNNIACAPSEDSGQPEHPLSLIRIYAGQTGRIARLN